MQLSDAVLCSLLSPPGSVDFSRKKSNVVDILAEVVLQVVFPGFELLKSESMRRELFRSAELQVGHEEDVGGAGVVEKEEALPPRWYATWVSRLLVPEGGAAAGTGPGGRLDRGGSSGF